MTSDIETTADDQEQKPKLTLEVDIQSRGACERHITVSVSRVDIDRYLKDAYGELQPKAEVPGFRPGRAPRKLVESKFKEQVADQVKGSLLMDSLTQIGEDHDFSAIGEPDFDLDTIDLPEEGPLTFEFNLEVRPEFDMPDWKGLSLKQPVHEYTDQEVQDRLELLLEPHGTLTDVEEPVELGDLVTAQLSARLGEEPLYDGALSVKLAPKLSFEDASIDNFGEIIAGSLKGETKDLTVTISEDSANESCRGKEVRVQVRIDRVRRMKLPELTPKFLEELGDFKSKDELLTLVRQELERQLAFRQQELLREQISAVLTEGADWELPKSLLERQASRELDRKVLELRSSGFPEQEIQRHANLLRQNSAATTAKALKEHFILERIAEEAEIDAAPEDFDKEIELIATQSSESPRRVRARLEKRNQMDSLRNQIVERKALQVIADSANIEEVPFTPENSDTFAVKVALAATATAIPEAKHGESEELREPADHT